MFTPFLYKIFPIKMNIEVSEKRHLAPELGGRYLPCHGVGRAVQLHPVLRAAPTPASTLTSEPSQHRAQLGPAVGGEDLHSLL